MVRYAACYPGQGAQYEKMAIDLYDRLSCVRELFSLASDTTHIDVYRLLSEGTEEELKMTHNTQIAVTVANRSATVALQTYGCFPICHAGFSLGELSAYAASQIITDETLFTVVQKRGELMSIASERALQQQGDLGMAAVLGLNFSQVQELLTTSEAQGLYCANDNSPSQVVVSGKQAELERCSALLKEAGARRIIPLRVSGPFHTPFMREAEEEFRIFLQNFSFKNPRSIVYGNVTGSQILTGDEARNLCALQLSHPVRWSAIMDSIVVSGACDAALEIGPGKVLTGFWRDAGALLCKAAGTFDQIEQICNEKGA